MLQNLMQIVAVVTSNGISRDQILSCISPTEKVFKIFVNGILSNIWDDDEAAAMAIFKVSPSDGRYRILKHRVKKRLLRFLFELSESSEKIDSVRNFHYKAMYHVAAAEILVSNSAVEAAQDEFDYALDLCEKYELFQIGLLAAYRLEDIQSSRTSTSRLEQLRQKTDFMLFHARNEIEARRLFDAYVQIAGSTVDYTKSVLQELKGVCARLEKLAQKDGARYIKMISLEASMYYSMMSNDYAAAAQRATSALSFMEKNRLARTKSRVGLFHNQLSYIKLQLGEIDAAKRHSQESLKNAVEYSANWAMRLSQLTLVHFRAEEYSEASQCLSAIRTYIAKNKTKQFWREKMLIYHGYLYYIFKTELFQSNDTMALVAREFEIHRFLDSSPLVTRDKTGANVSKVILYVLLLLAEGNIEVLNTRSESIRQYRQTYLKEPRLRRSSAFMKLIHLLIENDYNVGAVLHKGQKYIDELSNSDLSKSPLIEAVEPISYNRLWKIVISHVLNLQKHKITSLSIHKQRRR
jgi:hypothetical protein